MFGGDFNEIQTITERIGCSRRDRGMRDFNTIVDQLDMIDFQCLVRNSPGATHKLERNGAELTDFFLIMSGYKISTSSYGDP